MPFHLWTSDIAPNMCRFTFSCRSSWISSLIVPFRVILPFRLFGRFVPAGGGGGAPGLAFRGLESLCASRQASYDNGESADRIELLMLLCHEGFLSAHPLCPGSSSTQPCSQSFLFKLNQNGWTGSCSAQPRSPRFLCKVLKKGCASQDKFVYCSRPV